MRRHLPIIGPDAFLQAARIPAPQKSARRADRGQPDLGKSHTSLRRSLRRLVWNVRCITACDRV